MKFRKSTVVPPNSMTENAVSAPGQPPSSAGVPHVVCYGMLHEFLTKTYIRYHAFLYCVYSDITQTSIKHNNKLLKLLLYHRVVCYGMLQYTTVYYGTL